MAKNSHEKNTVKENIHTLNKIRDYLKKNVSLDDIHACKCYKNYKFNPEMATKVADAFIRKGEEDIVMVAITGDPTPTDWLDSDTPESSVGRIENKKTEYYTPYSENAHLISKGEIKNEKESVLKYYQNQIGNKARVFRLHCGSIFDYSLEVKNLPDAAKTNPKLAWRDIPASEMWSLVSKTADNAEHKEVINWYFGIGAHAAMWDDDIHICKHCGKPFRWHEESNWKYSSSEYEDVEDLEFRYTDWGKYPVLECPNCHEPLTREDQMDCKDLAEEAKAEAWILIEEHLVNEERKAVALERQKAAHNNKYDTAFVKRTNR